MNANQFKALRKRRRETQAEFWRRFGVTQSHGSRIEQGLAVPPALAILIELYLAERISDADLAAARRRSGA